jgi:hypothetical protein
MAVLNGRNNGGTRRPLGALVIGGVLATLFAGILYAGETTQQAAVTIATATATFPGSAADATQFDASKVTGAEACAKCHQSEHAAWQKSVHSGNHQRITSPAGKEYIKAYGSDQACAKCHSTPHEAGAAFAKKVVGVSCESCHSPAGGDSGWFALHSDYGGKDVKREEESNDHREKRLAACEGKGMIRAENVYALAKNCFSCHIVSDEKLLQAEHKPGQSAFELVSWIHGEVRHNFQVDQKTNAEGPSLLEATKGVTAQQRKRVLLVVGKMVELEICLQNLGSMNKKNLKKGYAGRKGWSGRAKKANDYLKKKVLAAVDDPDVQAAVDAASKVKLRRFKQQKEALAAAEAISIATQKFVAAHDGSKLAGLDKLVGKLPAPKGKAFQP